MKDLVNEQRANLEKGLKHLEEINVSKGALSLWTLLQTHTQFFFTLFEEIES